MRAWSACALLLAAGVSAGAEWNWELPRGFPRPLIPAGNPLTQAKVELGRRLFYDKRMSVNGGQSCASCHKQELAFTDGRARSEGTTGQLHPRGSMSLVNAAYAVTLTWAHPGMTLLEKQALAPMLGTAPVELGLAGHEARFLETLRGVPIYRDLFARAFPGQAQAFTLDNVTKALAAFERTIVSLRSPYDRYRWGGEENALSPAAKRGEVIFFSGERGGCFHCHGGWNFSGAVAGEGGAGPGRGGDGFANTGVSQYAAPNRGVFEHTARSEDLGRFRAPTLRNIALTSPYMHDGSMATLEEVVDHYARGGRYSHPNKDSRMQPLPLSPEDKRELIEFLRSLTDVEMTRDPRWSDPWEARQRPVQ